MKLIRLSSLSEPEREALEILYRTTKDPRLRTRAQMIFLSAEQKRTVPEIASIVRESEATVLRWFRRYQAEGIEGLADAPRAGRPPKVTPDHRATLVAAVRRRPRSLNQPFSLWTLQRLADYLAETTGVRVREETIRRLLKQEGIVLSRPQHKISSPDPEYLVKKRRLKPPATS